MSNETQLRKIDHLRMAVDRDVEHRSTTLLENVMLVHNAVPELDPDDVDLSTKFLGKRVKAPIMVTGMTGGHPATAEINCAIGEAVEELGLSMGVGSQRAAIENPSPEVLESFRAARKCAPSAPIVANIGFAQLVKGYGVAELEKIVELVEADALAIHLNVGQELAQPEGDRSFKGFLEKLQQLVERLSVPIIVKETGHGLSAEVVYKLYSKGVRYFDVSGAGGTSWIRVEYYRLRMRGIDGRARAADWLSDWGIPTAQSIIEARWSAPTACIIASGGIRSGLDVVKSLALGADIAGTALPVLRAYTEAGGKGVRNYLESLIEATKMAMVMTGSRSVRELRAREIILLEPLRSIVEQRGVSLELYMWVRSSYTPRC